MIEKIIEYKNYLLGVIGVLLALTMFVGVKYLMQPKYEELPEIKLKDIKSKKSFAIMVQNGDGYEEYTSKDNTWPGDEYAFKEAKCTDNNGALVENAITFDDGKATLTTNQTIYCTLYFDEKPKSTTDILREKDTQGYLSEDLQGGMYRYQASFPECDNKSACKNATQMTNWICFGTTNKEACTNEETGIDKYMYRIIGITEKGEMYLIKETVVKEGSTMGFAWNTIYKLPDCLGEACEWPNSDIYKRLNGTSNGTIQGRGDYGNHADTDIFVDGSEYDYLKSGDSNGGESPSEWYNLIEDHNWMYGDTNTSNDLIRYNGNEMYGIETGKTSTTRWWPTEGSQAIWENYIWSKSVSAKIGLMYMHDIDYAYPGGNPGSGTNIKNSWIHLQKDGYNTTGNYEWYITRSGVNGTDGVVVYARKWYIDDIGDGQLFQAYNERPVFYLSSKAKIANGNGTKTNPFTIEL